MKSAPFFDEKELLLRLRDGDKPAFKTVFLKFQPALVFFANRLLFAQTLQGAEEIVQDTFVKFHERQNTFDTMSQIKSFLYVVTKNACLQLIEKEKVREKRYEKFMVGFDEQEDLILREIVYTESIRQLREEVEKLPAKCREVMEKLIWEDKSTIETAEELGISTSTVKNQKARAVLLLKKRLSGTSLLLLFMYI